MFNIFKLYPTHFSRGGEIFLANDIGLQSRTLHYLLTQHKGLGSQNEF